MTKMNEDRIVRFSNQRWLEEEKKNQDNNLFVILVFIATVSGFLYNLFVGI